ncbi:dihydroorotase [Lutibaculum baratangense]|uniref:Dihydroorotase n=1 Tax=Lutibaculum baratangense AMV1 TaxID=631454 RepID=V4QV19_9HYPH|nr:dihydroorotase [Lutibaculum baratangense]ESR23602.1 Dihydroorotase [Lutibaculum baratangense AMV1]
MPTWATPESFEPRPHAPMLFRNVRLLDPSSGTDEAGNLLVVGGEIADRGPLVGNDGLPEGAEVIEGRGRALAPGLVDMRVFVGEPGYEHRETIASASRAAAAGGVTTIVCMPDTDPVIDDVALVDFVMRLARDTAIVNVKPMAALSKRLEGREMTEFGLLTEAGAVAFTEGRRKITSARMMRRLLTYARDFDALVVHQPEDPDLAAGGVVNESEMASRLGLPGIPDEAETIMLMRDLALAGLSGGRYHAACLSCRASLPLLRIAKERGFRVTASVSVANLALNETDIGPYRTFYKLSPPLRTEDDRQALVQGIADGTIDVIVSNHDPQDAETKRQPFEESADGAIGVETLLAAALRLYHSEDVSLLRLIETMSTTPARLLGLPGGGLSRGAPADLVFFDPDAPWVVERERLCSRSKNTCFENARMQGRVERTVVAGRTVYSYDSEA